MNVIVLLEDLEEKFANSPDPKIFHPIKDIPLLQWAIPFFHLKGPYFFGIKRKDAKYITRLENLLREIDLNYNIVVIEDGSLGSGHSAFMVSEIINKKFSGPDKSVIILESPYQNFVGNGAEFFKLINKGFDSVVGVYPYEDFEIDNVSDHTHIRVDHFGLGVELVDNFAISLYTLNNLYYLRDIRDLSYSVWKLIDEETDRINLSDICNNIISSGGTVAPCVFDSGSMNSLNSLIEISDFEFEFAL